MDVKGWQSQIRKGSAELVVLGLVRHRELYGSEILERARERGDLISEGALYPLLNRLEREGKLAARWSATDSGGHPRKYYRLTAEGEARFAAIRAAWTEFDAAMNRVMEEAENVRSAPDPRRSLSSQAG